MQRNYTRYLAPVFKRAQTATQQNAHFSAVDGVEGIVGDVEMPSAAYFSEADISKSMQLAALSIPPEFNGKDYVTFLLCIDAEIEHGLMLQYLYGAYSLGGPQVPQKFQEQVRSWQEVVLGIAKEEMGHFVSVQNVLKLMGAPLHFERQDYPWDTPFYPFPFKLEPLTLNSLAKYVYAEAPASWLESSDPDAAEIKKLVTDQVTNPNTVGALFDVLLQYIKDPGVVPDEVFQAATYPFQAKFDEWGRGYAGGQRGNAGGGSPAGSPDVLVVPLASRDDAYNALAEIAEQGEATDGNSTQPSHFKRFLKVYQEMRDVLKAENNQWQPARNVAVNPDIKIDTGGNENEEEIPDVKYITNPLAQGWAHLFNIRYRMLLNFLSHSFLLENGYNNLGAVAPRGMIINSTFGEMYNLRSIASVLVTLPVSNIANEPVMAGPTFLMPYTLNLPMGEQNRWRLHKDMIEASQTMIDMLLPVASDQQKRYLNSLREADAQLQQLIDEMAAATV